MNVTMHFVWKSREPIQLGLEINEWRLWLILIWMSDDNDCKMAVNDEFVWTNWILSNQNVYYGL